MNKFRDQKSMTFLFAQQGSSQKQLVYCVGGFQFHKSYQSEVIRNLAPVRIKAEWIAS